MFIVQCDLTGKLEMVWPNFPKFLWWSFKFCPQFGRPPSIKATSINPVLVSLYNFLIEWLSSNSGLRKWKGFFIRKLFHRQMFQRKCPSTSETLWGFVYFDPSFFFRFYQAKVTLKSLPWQLTWGSSAYTPVSETTPSQAHISLEL